MDLTVHGIHISPKLQEPNNNKPQRSYIIVLDLVVVVLAHIREAAGDRKDVGEIFLQKEKLYTSL